MALSMMWAFLSVAGGNRAINSPHVFAAVTRNDLYEWSPFDPASPIGTERVTTWPAQPLQGEESRMASVLFIMILAGALVRRPRCPLRRRTGTVASRSD